MESSGLFDPAWYRTTYPEIRRFPAGPLAHFVEHGLGEGRDPGPGFSTATYLQRRPEEEGPTEPPFLEAMRRGQDSAYLWMPEDRRALRQLVDASGFLDPTWYLRTYGDVARSGADPLEHFVNHGAYELRSPGPDFDSAGYAERYPEYAKLFRSPIEHYLRYGKSSGYRTRTEPTYAEWIELHDGLTAQDVDRIERDAAADPLPPVRIVALLDGVEQGDLQAMAATWRAQIGARWAVTAVLPAAMPEREQAIAEIIAAPRGLRMVASVGAAADTVEDAELVLICAGTALLAPHAAYVLARTMAHEQADGAYCDHDRLVEGERRSPSFKPQMSPEYLARSPYVGPAVALRAQAARDAMRQEQSSGRTGAGAIAEMVLRLDPLRIRRAPFVLYHLPGEEPAAPGPAEGPPAPHLPDDELPTVSIVIPTRDRGELLRACIDSLRSATDYPPRKIEIVVIDNDSRDPATLDLLDSLRGDEGTIVVSSPGAFNFSRINNEGVAHAGGDILVFLNNDTTVRRHDWLRQLVGFARKPETGAVGAKLLFPDDTIQHGGVVLGFEGVAAHRHVGLRFDELEAPDVTRETTGITGACLAIRRELFGELGGFDTALEVAFNDVLLCVASHRAGYRNIYVADPIIYHHESKSRGYDTTDAKKERNLREAAYAARLCLDVFRDDPAYSPNLSVSRRIDMLSDPPRVVRPWRRRHGGRRRVLLLSSMHARGFGVPIVLAKQAEALRRRGFEVIVGGTEREDDIDYEGCERVGLRNEREAASYAVREGIDAVVSHTPPFFNVARLLGSRPLCYAVDHGEPPPELFEDRELRTAIDRQKRHAAAFTERVFVVSRAIRGQQHRPDAIVLRNGNSHLAVWNDDWAARRTGIREEIGLRDEHLVLNVCRFERAERAYKGVGQFIAVAKEFGLLFPALKDRCVFALAGRGTKADVREIEAEGIRVFPNVGDERMRELYAASDSYMSFSRWEGYNLGIGQALAMGLPVIASDIEAHREFPIDTTNSTLEACELLARRIGEAADPRAPRRPVIESWDEPLDRLCDILEADLAADSSSWL